MIGVSATFHLIVSTTMKLKLSVLVLTCWLLATYPIPAAAVAQEMFEYHGGRVTLTSRGTPLSTILEAIAGAGDIEIILTGTETVSRPVWVEMIDRPLEGALQSLLIGISYAVVYGSSGESGVVTYNAQAARLAGKGPSPNPRTQERSNTDKNKPEDVHVVECKRNPILCKCIEMSGFTMQQFLDNQVTHIDTMKVIANCVSESQ